MSEAIDKWVRRLNRMAREMDDDCDGIHPTAWPEITKEKCEQWHRLAGFNEQGIPAPEKEESR